jgi:hypothetical protein
MEPAEIDGRIMMLQQQRDDALNRVVIMAGQLNKLAQDLAQLKENKNGGSGSGDRED